MKFKKLLIVFISTVSAYILFLVSFAAFLGNIFSIPSRGEGIGVWARDAIGFVAAYIGWPYPTANYFGRYICGECPVFAVNFSGIEKDILIWSCVLLVLIVIFLFLKRKAKKRQNIPQ